jgi:hypothetical protein
MSGASSGARPSAADRISPAGATRSASQPPAADDEPTPQFSLLKEAAALVEARGGTNTSCQVDQAHGTGCPLQAEVKLADTGGDAVWACLAHADEIIMTVPAAFIASQDDAGIAGFLSLRRPAEASH